ncbi:uncharacterized protein LOC117108204 [Anneissia japonica]|uniref:uncharacterized protein LOC117108204 n=1 Tax=Anneissia japonica TaxID=1529436 RepID=UPI0014257011|nr:uncharacterized protein LOC117108204 [Anneissia japonica]
MPSIIDNSPDTGDDAERWTPPLSNNLNNLMGRNTLPNWNEERKSHHEKIRKSTNIPIISLKLGIDVLLSWIFFMLLADIGIASAKPGFTFEPPPTHLATEGESVSLDCIVNTEAKSYKVVWTKDSKCIDNPAYFDPNRFIETKVDDRHYKLKIHPLKREDEGAYKCVGLSQDMVGKAIFSSGCQLRVMKVPGPQYPEVFLSKSQYSIGDDIVAHCFSERVDQPPTITWIPNSVSTEPFENSSHVGVSTHLEASKEVNQTTLLCKMIVHGVEVPLFKVSVPIVVKPFLEEVVINSSKSTLTAAVSAHTFADSTMKPTFGSGGEIQHASLITIFTCLVVILALLK